MLQNDHKCVNCGSQYDPKSAIINDAHESPTKSDNLSTNQFADAFLNDLEVKGDAGEHFGHETMQANVNPFKHIRSMKAPKEQKKKMETVSNSLQSVLLSPSQQSTFAPSTTQQHQQNLTLSNNQTVNTTIDLSIFGRNGDHCNNLDCEALKRIMISMKYASMLEDSSIREDILLEFFQNEYTNLLDDYHHLIKVHGHEAHKLKEILMSNHGISCDGISHCNASSRHHRNPDISDLYDNNNDPSFMIFSETLDSLHFYIFHLYDVGLRVSHDMDHKQDDELYSFTDIKRRIDSRRENIRFSQNKFNIMLAHDEDKSMPNDDKFTYYGEGTTWIDSLGVYLLNDVPSVTQVAVKSLQAFFAECGYDTDSIVMDVNDWMHEGSNISRKIQDNNMMSFIANFASESRM